MIKVIPQTHKDPHNKLSKMNIGNKIILELVFDENQFSMYSTLIVTELDKVTQTGKARLCDVRESYKTFNDYSAYYGRLIPFSYTDISDVEI